MVFNSDIIWSALLYNNCMEENMYFTNKMYIILCTLWYITFLKECWCQISLDVVWYFLTSNISKQPILILFFLIKENYQFLVAPFTNSTGHAIFFVAQCLAQRRSPKLVIGWRVRVDCIQFLSILYLLVSLWFYISGIFTKPWRSDSKESISFWFCLQLFLRKLDL